MSLARPVVHQIPVCPFCQRLEILLALKGQRGAVDFEVVDITKPRSEHLLALTGGSTALPVLELPDGRSLKESLVLLRYLDETVPGPDIRRADPFERAVENLVVAAEDRFNLAGYRLVMNQDPAARDQRVEAWYGALGELDALLRRYGSQEGPWLFDRFGWAELVFTPFFQRFVFLPYFEGVDIPEGPGFDRVRAWRDASVAHPAAQQTSDEEVIKVYYDYSRGKGNGALPEGRSVSTFAFEPSWTERPMPPRDKYGPGATDAELGLLPAPDTLA